MPMAVKHSGAVQRFCQSRPPANSMCVIIHSHDVCAYTCALTYVYVYAYACALALAQVAWAPAKHGLGNTGWLEIRDG